MEPRTCAATPGRCAQTSSSALPTSYIGWHESDITRAACAKRGARTGRCAHACDAGHAAVAHSSQSIRERSGPTLRERLAGASTKTTSEWMRDSSRAAFDAPTPRMTKRGSRPPASRPHDVRMLARCSARASYDKIPMTPRRGRGSSGASHAVVALVRARVRL